MRCFECLYANLVCLALQTGHAIVNYHYCADCHKADCLDHNEVLKKQTKLNNW